MSRALDLVSLQWSAITGVAKALQEKTELSEAEITALCNSLLVKKQETGNTPSPITNVKDAVKRLKKAPKPPAFMPKNWQEGIDYEPA